MIVRYKKDTDSQVSIACVLFCKNKKFLKANSHILSLIVIKTKRGNKMEALVTAAKNGDKEAFVQLIRINKQSMYKAAWVYLRNEPGHCRCTAKYDPVLLCKGTGIKGSEIF